MKSYDEIERSVRQKASLRIAEQKRHKTAFIRRTAALTFGTAAVLGIGVFTQAMKAPRKPAHLGSNIVSETSTTTSATTTANITTEKSILITTTSGSTTAHTSSTRVTTSSAINSTIVSVHTTAGTTHAVSAETTHQTTTAPAKTTPTTSTANLEERIANIYMKMSDMAPILQQYSAINEKGERIPTCAMMFPDKDYLAIISFEKGGDDYHLDINNDGRVDYCDLLEVSAYSQTYVSGYPSEKYKQSNYLAMRKAIPDDNTYRNLAQFTQKLKNEKWSIFTEYMIFKGFDIPDSDDLDVQLKEYAGDRPIPEKAFSDVLLSVTAKKKYYDELYDFLYKDLNKEHVYSDFQLEMFGKIDSGEYFPDANRDGVIDYMDIYKLILYNKYYETMADEKDWLYENCIYSPNDNLMVTKNYLVLYLFYYKGQDYVSNIEMQLEYEKETERLSAPTVIP